MVRDVLVVGAATLVMFAASMLFTAFMLDIIGLGTTGERLMLGLVVGTLVNVAVWMFDGDERAP